MTREISIGEKGTLGTLRTLNQPGVVREGFLEEVIPETSLKDMRTGQCIKYHGKKKSVVSAFEDTMAEKPVSLGWWEEIVLEATYSPQSLSPAEFCRSEFLFVFPMRSLH